MGPPQRSDLRSAGRTRDHSRFHGNSQLHVARRGCTSSLCSSSHGAGSQMSRAQAFKSISARELCRQMREVWFDHRLAEKLRDESPSAYKDIQEVMRCQRELTRITRKLRPILCFKGI